MDPVEANKKITVSDFEILSDTHSSESNDSSHTVILGERKGVSDAETTHSDTPTIDPPISDAFDNVLPESSGTNTDNKFGDLLYDEEMDTCSPCSSDQSDVEDDSYVDGLSDSKTLSVTIPVDGENPSLLQDGDKDDDGSGVRPVPYQPVLKSKVKNVIKDKKKKNLHSKKT